MPTFQELTEKIQNLVSSLDETRIKIEKQDREIMELRAEKTSFAKRVLDEIVKASKNPVVKWRHVDIQYYNSLTPTNTPTEPGVFYVLQGSGTGSFRVIVGEPSTVKTSIINIDQL